MRLPKNNSYDDVLSLKAARIAYLISDYENYPYFGPRGTNNVLRWAKQFDEPDRLFLLSELEHIIPKSYLSKEDAIAGIDSMFTYFKDQLNLNTIDELLDQSHFLSCQDSKKSQSQLLKFVDNILTKKFGRSLNSCGINPIKYWFYIDDVLATGKTFEDNITEVVENYGIQNFKDNSIQILSIFFFLHNWASSNLEYIFKKKWGDDFITRLKFYHFFEIQNNPNRNYFIGAQSHNHAFPRRSNQPPIVEEYLESLSHATTNEKHAFRSDNEPISEVFFSSPDARNRYEQIILLKGIELINKIQGEVKPNVRPLGFIRPSYKTFGLGSHTFTWRNISNTCPLVFWWEANGWYPLFHVKNRGI
jgi:hypothetical protein